jgi:hypothetical protein
MHMYKSIHKTAKSICLTVNSHTHSVSSLFYLPPSQSPISKGSYLTSNKKFDPQLVGVSLPLRRTQKKIKIKTKIKIKGE